jgi:hypothetical protein
MSALSFEKAIYWVQIGVVCGPKQEPRADFFKGVASYCAPVGGQVVEDDDIAAYSDVFGHPFRLYPATCSDVFGHP